MRDRKERRRPAANYLGTMSASRCVDYAETTVETLAPEDTRAIARRLGGLLLPGDLVALVGPLGAGKTCFVQGLAEGLDIAGPVTSPTFVLMRLHRGAMPLCHVDAYRLAGAGELLDLGFDDWLEESVVALEWADTVCEALPPERIEVLIEYAGDGRLLRLRGIGPRAAQIIERMKSDDDPRA